MKYKTKVLSWLLAFSLLLCILPISAIEPPFSKKDQSESQNQQNLTQEISSSEPSGYSLDNAAVRSATISSGVYALNAPNTNVYVRSLTTTGGTYVMPVEQADPFLIRATMFKIIYRAETDDYVIRSMANSEIVICPVLTSNGAVTRKQAGKSDSEISADMAWNITSAGNGYYYISATLSGTTYYMIRTASPHIELTTDQRLSGTKWNLIQYTGNTIRGWGKIGTWTAHIQNGSSATFEAYIYSSVIGENSARLVNLSDEGVADTVQTSNLSQITVTPKYGGNTKLSIQSIDGSVVYGDHHLISGWDSGCFFIKNKQSSEYLTVLGGASEAQMRLTSLPNGTDKEYTLWKFKYWADGYYWILPDIVGGCLHDPNTGYNMRLALTEETATIRNLWRFIPQSDGTIKIQSYLYGSNNANYYMSLDNATTKNVQALANTGARQDWTIQPLRYNISVLYDQAFKQLHAAGGYLNALDSAFLDSTGAPLLVNNMLSRLGIHAVVNYVSTSDSTYNSLPYSYDCSLLDAENISHICNNNHASEPYDCTNTDTSTQLEDCQNGYHHKNGNRMIQELPYIARTDSTDVRILFTGFTCCNIYDNQHTPSSFFIMGWSTLAGTRCLIMQGDLFVLTQHELTHVLGAHDCTGQYSPACIMGTDQFSEEVYTNMTLCPTCTTNIQLLKYTFYNH